MFTENIRDIFVGRTDILNEFRGSFTVKQQQDVPRIFIIKGQAGTGKSKLLEVFEKTAQSERLKTFLLRTPINTEMLKSFPKLILENIQDILPEPSKQKNKAREKKWKGRKPFTEWMPEDLPAYFFEKLEEQDEDLKEARDAVILLLDNVENFILKQELIAETFSLIFKMADWIIEKKANIIMVFSIDSNYLEYLKHDVSRYKEFDLLALDMREAEVLIRRVEKEILGETINQEIRLEIVKMSDRTPFSIISALSYIASREKEEIGKIFDSFASSEEDVEESESEIIDSPVWKSLKNKLASNYLEKMVNFTKLESRLIHFLLPNSQDNLFSLSEMVIDEDLVPAIGSLAEKKFLIKEGDFFQFTSNAMYDFLKRRSAKPITFMELNVYLDLINDFIDEEIKPPEFLIVKFRDGVNQINQQKFVDIDKLLAYDTAVTTELYAQKLFELKYYHDAFTLFINTGTLFNLADDIERAAATFENSSKLFIENRLPIYAKNLLINASDLFANTGLDYKAKSMAREALWLIEEIADDYSSKSLHNLARAYYYHAQKLCDIADESDKKMTLIEKAIKSSGTSEIRKEYFENLLPEEEKG